MKSIVKTSAPSLNPSTGLQNSWGNAPDINYDCDILFENGASGINSSRKAGASQYYIVGNECEYELALGKLKQDGTSWPMKITRPKSSFQSGGNFKGGSNQSTKGYALRYAVDAWIAGKIEKDAILKTADYFHDYMEAKPVAPVQPSGTIATPVHEAFVPDAKPELDSLPF